MATTSPSRVAASPTAVALRSGAPVGPPQRPVSVRRLVLRFSAAGVIVLAGLVLTVIVVSRRTGVEEALRDARASAELIGRGIVAPAVTPGVLRGDPAALAELDEVVRERVFAQGLVRVKVWNEEGEVLYADEPSLIGQVFPLDDEELEVLAGGDTVADVSRLDRSENASEPDADGGLVEVYTAIDGPDGPLLFEGYYSSEVVDERSREVWRNVLPLAVGGLLVLQLLQVPLAWSMARRLRAGQEQRERLLQHALEASDAERRRIASDLHDGVVQELTGVSYTLTAARLRGGDVDEAVLNESAARVRDSIRSLRSLLVDIYPPNLFEEGLPAALSDLLTRLEQRGVATDLTVGEDLDDLPEQLVALLYRTAQETLRNVVAHADASSVAVVVSRERGRVRLVVTDDGRGFDTAELVHRPADGHVGLRSLADLAAEVGGRVTVRSSPGTGTSVELEVELR